MSDDPKVTDKNLKTLRTFTIPSPYISLNLFMHMF